MTFLQNHQHYTCVVISFAVAFLRLKFRYSQIGNLSFYTTEEQIYEVFTKCASPEDGGGIKRIIMGLDRNTRCVGTRIMIRIVYLVKIMQNTLWLLFRRVLYTRRSL